MNTIADDHPSLQVGVQESESAAYWDLPRIGRRLIRVAEDRIAYGIASAGAGSASASEQTLVVSAVLGSVPEGVSRVEPPPYSSTSASSTASTDLPFSVSESRARGAFLSELGHLLASEHADDELSAATELIASALSVPDSRVSMWIQSFFLENITNTGLASDILCAMGHLPRRLVEPWGYTMVIAALGQPSIRVRDAAVRALERWGGTTAIRILADHAESAPWLRRYIDGVLSDLRS